MTDTDPASLLIIVALIVLALLSYFLPTVVASMRHHADRGAIFIINLLLGWSLIGWVAALAWASQGLRNYNQRHYFLLEWSDATAVNSGAIAGHPVTQRPRAPMHQTLTVGHWG